MAILHVGRTQTDVVKCGTDPPSDHRRVPLAVVCVRPPGLVILVGIFLYGEDMRTRTKPIDISAPSVEAFVRLANLGMKKEAGDMFAALLEQPPDINTIHRKLYDLFDEVGNKTITAKQGMERIATIESEYEPGCLSRAHKILVDFSKAMMIAASTIEKIMSTPNAPTKEVAIL